MKLSVIIPCMNEEENIFAIYEALSKTLKEIKHELIFVDDGSTDKTLEKLKELYGQKKANLKIIAFSRNFKKEAAMYAGLSKASGEYISIIDADMQQNPEYLITMFKFLEENKNFDQVAMIMNKKQADGRNIFHKFSKMIFYKLIDAISDTKFVRSASDFRMFRNYVKDAILSLSENNRFSKGIFSWIGFNTKYMEYEVTARAAGKTKFSFKANMKYAFDGIIGFSTKPLRIATVLGVLTSFIAFIYVVVILAQILIYGIDVPGYASTLIVVLLLGGIQLITIGILGEYLAKTFVETKKRPIYIAKEEIGFEKILY